jgi:hypothetical protein
MKRFIYTCLFLCITCILVGQKVTIKDNSDNVLMEVVDEGTTGSILLPPITFMPSPSGNKLYNLNDLLYWGNTKVGTMHEGGGWKVVGSNLFPRSLTYEIGIGTETPSYSLDVQKNTSVNNINPIARFRTLGGNSSGAIRLQNSLNNFFSLGITQDPDNAFGIAFNNNME